MNFVGFNYLLFKRIYYSKQKGKRNENSQNIDIDMRKQGRLKMCLECLFNSLI